MFCFNHAFAFYTNNKIVKNVDEWQIQSTKSKPEILPEIHVVMISWASHALNMSGYFDQSARSIESRCVVKGDARSQDISTLDIEPVLPEYATLSTKGEIVQSSMFCVSFDVCVILSFIGFLVG